MITIPISFIKEEVEKYFDLSLGSIDLNTRKREVVQSRQIAMYFSDKFSGCSYEIIGKNIGNRDHSTVTHACKTVNDLIDTDKKFKADIEEIEKHIVKYNKEYLKDQIINLSSLYFGQTSLQKKLIESIFCCD